MSLITHAPYINFTHMKCTWNVSQLLNTTVYHFVFLKDILPGHMALTVPERLGAGPGTPKVHFIFKVSFFLLNC